MPEEFDYELLKEQVLPPDAQLTITGDEFHQIKNLVKQALDLNSLSFRDDEGKVVGMAVIPSVQPVADLYALLYRSFMRKFYEAGSTMTIEEFKASIEAKQAAAREVVS